MHSFEAPSGRTYHHNGDFSGDVHVPVDAGLQVPTYESVPFADLVALVAKAKRRSLVDALEGMSAADVMNAVIVLGEEH